MSQELIFGYGSLLNLDSLKATIADPGEIKAAYIRGFRRDFSLWDKQGFTDTNPAVANIPHCALDVQKGNATAEVNGVCFAVNEDQFAKLLEREHDYELVKTMAYDFHTNEPIGACAFFSAHKHNGTYDFDNKAQQRYLEICLEGAKEFGAAFYQTFLDTTYLGTTKLSELPELLVSG
jgi:cation transport regulator ChaC